VIFLAASLAVPMMQYVRAGVHHIVLAPVAADETDVIGSPRRIAGAVLPHIRPPGIDGDCRVVYLWILDPVL